MTDSWTELREGLIASVDLDILAIKERIDAKIKEAEQNELMAGIHDLADSLTSIQSSLQDLRSRVTAIEAKLTEED